MSRLQLRFFPIFIFCFYFILSNRVEACTDFRLTAKDGTILIARSMEFGMPFNSNIRTSVRGRSFATTTPNNKPGLSWQAKNGYLYFDGMNQDFAVDGMNEKGLSFEALYLPGETQYQTIPTGKDNQALPYLNFGDWVLGNFNSVDEVRAALPNVFVYAKPISVPGASNIIFPLHAAIYDASGKGIIVEFVNGQVNVYDNQVGILTNSPQYPWHIANLRNYVNLTAYNPQPIVSGNLTFSATGQGGGAVGLPGDYTPPSRFIKIGFLLNNIVPTADAANTVNLAEHMINNVDIAVGAVRAKQGNAPGNNELTQWVVFKDLTHKRLYYRFYADMTLRSVDMTKLDFSQHAPMLSMPVDVTPLIVDMTSKMQPNK